LVINSHLHMGAHGNAGAVASLPLGLSNGGQMPEQLVSQASLWELEQRYLAHGLDPSAAYDERALSEAFASETQAWIDKAAQALAHCVVSGTAFLDIDTVVIDGSFCPALQNQVIERTNAALQSYNWEGLWPATVIAGNVGPDARALGGALLPLHANFAPDQGLFLKVGA
jgi:predicted NBD/HSP70 family sugar kinase